MMFADMWLITDVLFIISILGILDKIGHCLASVIHHRKSIGCSNPISDRQALRAGVNVTLKNGFSVPNSRCTCTCILHCSIATNARHYLVYVAKSTSPEIVMWRLQCTNNQISILLRKRPISLSHNSFETIQSRKYLLYDV